MTEASAFWRIRSSFKQGTFLAFSCRGWDKPLNKWRQPLFRVRFESNIYPNKIQEPYRYVNQLNMTHLSVKQGNIILIYYLKHKINISEINFYFIENIMYLYFCEVQTKFMYGM
jgi:hypothetical protein